MPFSNFKILWDASMPFASLKMINVEYSVNLKSTPNFGNSKSIERLHFRGCESLLKLHPSIRELTGLYVLDLRECIYVKDLAESLGQSSKLAYLYLGYCSNLRQLPKQLGGMKWLKVLDASHTAIEQLPDSFVGLINLERLDLRRCKNLRNLPNSIWKLKLLRVLNLGYCSKLEQLTNELEKLQCLEELYVSSTAIEDLPYSIGLLSRLRVLDLSYCMNLKHLPESVWNLPSLTVLYLSQTDITRIKVPVIVKDTKLVTLTLECSIGVWLPVILSFFALKHLILSIGSEGSSSTKPFSLSKLYNLQHLILYNCTCFGSSFPELPLSITNLFLHDHATLSHLPDLSSLKKLKKLGIYSYISLQTLPPLPPHLQSLIIDNCTSLRHLSDMSMLKELSDLQCGRCSKRKSVGLKKSFLEVMDVIKHFLPFYEVEAPKTAEWFSYKSTGTTVSFDIPTLSADNFLGLAVSVLFTNKNRNVNFSMIADVTNKTNGATKSCPILLTVSTTGAEVIYVVKCIRGDELSVRSGDKITILLRRQIKGFYRSREVPLERGKVEMFAAHVIQRTLSTPDFPSVLSNLIDPCDTRNILHPRHLLRFEQLYKLTRYLLIFVVFCVVLLGLIGLYIT